MVMRLSDQRDRPIAFVPARRFWSRMTICLKDSASTSHSRRNAALFRQSSFPEQRRSFCPTSLTYSAMVTYCVYGRRVEKSEFSTGATRFTIIFSSRSDAITTA